VIGYILDFKDGSVFLCRSAKSIGNACLTFNKNNIRPFGQAASGGFDIHTH
jgi:hypothetical protein